MNAFGKRNNLGAGQRPSFGVARPMKGGAGSGGGDQFPPVPEEVPTPLEAETPSEDGGGSSRPTGAMDRLNDRQNASGAAASSKSEGFEASVHRITEEVLPR